MDADLLKGTVGLSDDAMCVAKLKDGSLLREDIGVKEDLKRSQRELFFHRRHPNLNGAPGSQLA